MEHLININFAPGGLPAVAHVSQFDDTLRVLKFQLWFGRNKVEVPSGASVRLDLLKPDGHIVLATGTVDSSDRSIVTVETSQQMTAVGGASKCVLVIVGSGNERISSALVVLHVHKDPVEDGDASASDLSYLQDAIDQTASNASSAAASATAAAASATAAAEAAASVTTDTTLSVSGQAADAAETGRQFGLIKADLGNLSDLDTTDKSSIVAAINEAAQSGGGSGLTDDIKTALMNLVNHLAWDDDDPTGQTYITALYNALYPPADLVSISAVYTQSGAIYESNTLDDLKDDLIVTALMSDQTTRSVTDYTLSGTLAEGTSTITVTYGGKTATFNVTVSHETVFVRNIIDYATVVREHAYGVNSDIVNESWTDTVYSISNIHSGDVLILPNGWNEDYWSTEGNISKVDKSTNVPQLTLGEWVKSGTAYGYYPITINENLDVLYVKFKPEYSSVATWTRESGF